MTRTVTKISSRSSYTMRMFRGNEGTKSPEDATKIPVGTRDARSHVAKRESLSHAISACAPDCERARRYRQSASCSTCCWQVLKTQTTTALQLKAVVALFVRAVADVRSAEAEVK